MKIEEAYRCAAEDADIYCFFNLSRSETQRVTRYWLCHITGYVLLLSPPTVTINRGSHALSIIDDANQSRSGSGLCGSGLLITPGGIYRLGACLAECSDETLSARFPSDGYAVHFLYGPLSCVLCEFHGLTT